jgi:nicotinamide/nicotinate riboside kinase
LPISDNAAFFQRVQTDPEGTFWRDPPDYWENIVWPAYVDAHSRIFENGDVEHGKPTGVIEGLVLLETLDMSMTEAVERCCQVINGVAQDVYSGQ